MGFNTEYLGHLEITPHLNAAEVQWLSGFADWGGIPDGDPFTLPMNPRAELAAVFDRAGGSMSPQGRIPNGVYDWRACEHGDRISWRRGEKSNDAVEALRFLVSHYLGPGALAQQSGNPDFAESPSTTASTASSRASATTPTSCSCCGWSIARSPGRPSCPA